MNHNTASALVKKLIVHLEEDIMPYWMSPAMLGCPIGNFPTFATQTAVPFYGALNYARMQGRATYAYLAAYEITNKVEYRDVGLRGMSWLERLKRPGGGYYPITDYKGTPYNVPVSVQDLSYIGLPLSIAYSITGDQGYLDDLWSLIDFILAEKFFRNGRLVVDALSPDYSSTVFFEGAGTNIVSLLDFLNALYLPALEVSPNSMRTEQRVLLLQKLVGNLVDDFYSDGIFWNERGNRNIIYIKHVDFGHTAKAYGVLYNANRFLKMLGVESANFEHMIERFSSLVKISSDENVGWRTDFEDTGRLSVRAGLQWWRHIVIDQVVSLYANINIELEKYLGIGIETWFSLDYIDKTRPCRGIRQFLSATGVCDDNFDYSTCKANEWKSAYHEVDHVRRLTNYFDKFSIKGKEVSL